MNTLHHSPELTTFNAIAISPPAQKLMTALMIIAAHVALIASIMLIKAAVIDTPTPKEVYFSVVTAKPTQSEPKLVVSAKALPPPSQVFVPAPETLTIQAPSPILTVTSTPPVETLVKNTPTASFATPTPSKEQTGPKVVSAVEYVNAPQADYPSIAKRMGEEGRVVMQVLVNEKGRAEKVDVVQSSGFKRLDEAAKLALMRALFKPYLEDGKAMNMLATASINFSLRS